VIGECRTERVVARLYMTEQMDDLYRTYGLNRYIQDELVNRICGELKNHDLPITAHSDGDHNVIYELMLDIKPIVIDPINYFLEEHT